MMTGPEAVAALPDIVRVGPFDWRVEKWAPLDAAEQRCFGQCSCLQQVIRIQSNLPSAIKAVDTFLHEVLHAIWWSYGIYDEDKEERTVSQTGTALTALHRDNPWLSAWITKALSA